MHCIRESKLYTNWWFDEREVAGEGEQEVEVEKKHTFIFIIKKKCTHTHIHTKREQQTPEENCYIKKKETVFYCFDWITVRLRFFFNCLYIVYCRFSFGLSDTN